MAELKTKKTEASVDDFLNSLPSEQTQKDCFEIVKLMGQATKAKPKMWGSSIIGFGSTHLKYASGRELDWMMIGFSPRKQNLTLYRPASKVGQTQNRWRLFVCQNSKRCGYQGPERDHPTVCQSGRQEVRSSRDSHPIGAT